MFPFLHRVKWDKRHDSLLTICGRESERNAARLAAYENAARNLPDLTERQARGIEIKRLLLATRGRPVFVREEPRFTRLKSLERVP